MYPHKLATVLNLDFHFYYFYSTNVRYTVIMVIVKTTTKCTINNVRYLKMDR